MGDADLEEIRRARLQQLRQQGGGSSGGNNAGGGGGGGDNEDQAEQQRQREAEARSSILSQILEPSALDRLGRIRLVKASRAEDVENRLITLARSGQLRQKVTEQQLRDLLGQLSEQEEKSAAKSVTVQRRKGGWDDDDLEDLLGEDI